MHRLYLVAIFLSAFLLFQVQPLVSKAILPWFGGAPAVWTACMLFFQILLFLGYLYAHLISSSLRPVTLAILHTCMIVAAIALLPVLPDASWKPAPDGVPTLQILSLLTVCVGLPFFLLASSAPLIQVWWQRTRGEQPYRLYALSNTGSLLALLTFPVLFEPWMPTSTLGTVWSVSFIVLAVMLIVGAWYSSRVSDLQASQPGQDRESKLPKKSADRRNKATADRDASSGPSTWSSKLAWLLLPAMGVVVLLSTTRYVCRDVAVVPFLWIAPLVVYLLSFILCFGRATGYRRAWYSGLVIVSTFGCAFLYSRPNNPDFMLILAINLTSVFACCMLCHGELIRLKPPADSLTSFYLFISAGGVIGGIAVSLVAPVIFTDYYEYPLGWIACWFIMFAVLFKSNTSRLHRGRPLWAWSLLIICFLVCSGLFFNGAILRSRNVLVKMRNFYGVLTVKEKVGRDITRNSVGLWHGVVVHGRQYLDKSRRFEPTTYYTDDSGVAYAIDAKSKQSSRHIGVIGLGVGTLAAYAHKGDRFRFYEIDPHVILLAESLFAYLPHAADTGANIEIIEGDARRSLEEEADQQFDVLVIDAFSSDSIPVHLVTVEAFDVYLRHLKPDGILALHISNNYLDLIPLGAALARQHNLEWLDVLEPIQYGEGGSEWLLIARKDVLRNLRSRRHVVPNSGVRKIEPWTDNYSNLMQLLR